MKYKIKSFFRHNKHCFAMWLTFWELFCLLIPPYRPLDFIYQSAFLVLSALVWLYQHRVFYLERLHVINKYRLEHNEQIYEKNTAKYKAAIYRILKWAEKNNLSLP